MREDGSDGHRGISSGQKQKSGLARVRPIAGLRCPVHRRYKLDLKRDTRHAPAITTMVNDISPLARRAASNLIALGQDVGSGGGKSGRDLDPAKTGRERPTSLAYLGPRHRPTDILFSLQIC